MKALHGSLEWLDHRAKQLHPGSTLRKTTGREVPLPLSHWHRNGWLLQDDSLNVQFIVESNFWLAVLSTVTHLVNDPKTKGVDNAVLTSEIRFEIELCSVQESRFCLWTYDGRRRVERRHRRREIQFYLERKAALIQGVMVWGTFSCHNTSLH